MKTNLFKPQYTILQNVLYDKNDVDCVFVPTSLWQFLCSSHFLCPWNVYISFISFKCLIFFLGFNVDLISNDDSSGPCRHISGPNRPRDLQSINSREPWDSSRNRWILKVFPGSTIAMVGSWMKCQTFVISKCIYIRRFINTSDQVISIVQARYFIFHECRKLKCDNWIYFALLGILLSSLWAKFPFLLVILLTDFPMIFAWFSKKIVYIVDNFVILTFFFMCDLYHEGNEIVLFRCKEEQIPHIR